MLPHATTAEEAKAILTKLEGAGLLYQAPVHYVRALYEMTDLVTLEKEWLEFYESAQAIHDTCVALGCKVQVLTRAEMRAMDSHTFWHKCGTLFCSTDITQPHLHHLKLEHLIPDTYTKAFQAFYKRRIVACCAKDVTEFPIFIKPQARLQPPISALKLDTGQYQGL